MFIREWHGIPANAMPDQCHRPPNLYNQLKVTQSIHSQGGDI